MRKTIITLMLGASLAIMGGFEEEAKQVGLTKNESGMTILDMKGDTIVAEVVSGNSAGSNLVNVFDKDNELFIDKKYPKGTVLLVELDKDQYPTAKKNDLNIAGKIEGQKILD